MVTTPILNIAKGHAHIHWRQAFARHDEFDWDYYNDCIDRLIAKTKQAGGIQKVDVVRVRRWPEWVPDPVAVANTMMERASGKPMIGYMFLMGEDGNPINVQPHTPINEPYRPQSVFKNWGQAVFPPQGI